MSATSINVAAAPVESSRLVSPSLVFRLILSALAVLACYQLQWDWLRSLTCDWNTRIDAVFGVYLHRVAFDTVLFRGQSYHYAVACTMADVFCGAIPLILDRKLGIRRNLILVAAFAVALVSFNVLRLSFSDVIFAWGLSWNWAHNVVSGVCYFIIWEWILTRKTLHLHTPVCI